MRLISQWLGNAVREECNYEQLQETDHYFRTHVHFEGQYMDEVKQKQSLFQLMVCLDVGQVLKERLQFGYFFCELAQMINNEAIVKPDNHCSDLSVDCVVVKCE